LAKTGRRKKDFLNERGELAMNGQPYDAQLQQLIESIPAPMVLMSAMGELEAANRQVLEYFGKTVDELRAWRAGNWIHADDLPRAVAKWRDALETGRGYEHESRHLRHDGEFRWMQVRVFPLRDANGRINHWLLFENDIHDRKRAEEALAASEQRLDQIVNSIPTLA
jgi:PAS domain S-box-containing protein